MKFPGFYGIRRFITTFTSARQLSLSRYYPIKDSKKMKKEKMTNFKTPADRKWKVGSEESCCMKPCATLTYVTVCHLTTEASSLRNRFMG
jgi:hypothetical protein